MWGLHGDSELEELTRLSSLVCVPVLRAAPDPAWELGSFLHASERVNTGGEYVLVKVCGFVEWANDSDIPYKSRNVVCRDHGTILKTGDPRFRSWFGKNLPYSLRLRMCEISFSRYKMKMALYPKYVSRDWLKEDDLWCIMPWIRNLPRQIFHFLQLQVTYKSHKIDIQ